MVWIRSTNETQKIWDACLIDNAINGRALITSVRNFLLSTNPTLINEGGSIDSLSASLNYIFSLGLNRCESKSESGETRLNLFMRGGPRRAEKIMSIDFIFQRAPKLADALFHPQTNHKLILEYIDRYPWSENQGRAEANKRRASRSRRAYRKKTGPKPLFKSRDVKTKRAWGVVS
jgi:hypothetical protein